jgi:hypothetical protein
MKLCEAIKDLPGDEWLDISEVKIDKPRHIGRIPKELLKGEILNREVVKHLSDIRPEKYGYSIHRFYVESRKNEVHKFD